MIVSWKTKDRMWKFMNLIGPFLGGERVQTHRFGSKFALGCRSKSAIFVWTRNRLGPHLSMSAAACFRIHRLNSLLYIWTKSVPLFLLTGGELVVGFAEPSNKLQIEQNCVGCTLSWGKPAGWLPNKLNLTFVHKFCNYTEVASVLSCRFISQVTWVPCLQYGMVALFFTNQLLYWLLIHSQYYKPVKTGAAWRIEPGRK